MKIKNDNILKKQYLFKNFYVFKKIYIKINAYIKKKSLTKKSFILYKIPFTKIKIYLNLKRDVDKGIFLGTFEYDNRFIFCELVKKNNVVIDIGANIGLYTLLAGNKLQNTGKIYAFEPSQVAVKELRKNIEKNKYKNIDTYEVALSDSNEKREFYRCEDDAYNSLIAKPMHGIISKDIVNVITLDEFARLNNLRRIDIIKIDAEGMDYSILKGAQMILMKFRPIIFCEMNSFYLNAKLRGSFIYYLEKLGYELLATKSHKFCLRIEKLDPINYNNTEIICFPKNK